MRLINSTSLISNAQNNQYVTIEETMSAPEIDPISPTPFWPLCGAIMDAKER